MYVQDTPAVWELQGCEKQYLSNSRSFSSIHPHKYQLLLCKSNWGVQLRHYFRSLFKHCLIFHVEQSCVAVAHDDSPPTVSKPSKSTITNFWTLVCHGSTGWLINVYSKQYLLWCWAITVAICWFWVLIGFSQAAWPECCDADQRGFIYVTRLQRIESIWYYCRWLNELPHTTFLSSLLVSKNRSPLPFWLFFVGLNTCLEAFWNIIRIAFDGSWLLLEVLSAW